MLYDVLLKEKQFKIKCSCISFALEQKHTQDKLPILCAASLCRIRTDGRCLLSVLYKEDELDAYLITLLIALSSPLPTFMSGR